MCDLTFSNWIWHFTKVVCNLIFSNWIWHFTKVVCNLTFSNWIWHNPFYVESAFTPPQETRCLDGFGDWNSFIWQLIFQEVLLVTEMNIFFFFLKQTRLICCHHLLNFYIPMTGIYKTSFISYKIIDVILMNSFWDVWVFLSDYILSD